MSNPTLTIVIPTLNEGEYLPKLLNALLMQTHQADEIIIADAGSKDNTVEIAKKFNNRVVQGGLPAVGRNAGARVAKSDLVLFLDADVIPPVDFVALSLDEFTKRNLDAATCLIEPLLDSNSIDKIICIGTNLYFHISNPISPHAPGFCILSKRSFHEKLDGFDESLFLSEDIDYAKRATQNGRFGFLTSTRIPVSMRRVRKEGLLGIGYKYLWCEIQTLMGKPIRNAPFRYEFGNFNIAPSHQNKQWIKQQWKSLVRTIGGIAE
jgi:glycosyltransferase involved in cell wall biosynthesis